jgi:hypothetical protein
MARRPSWRLAAIVLLALVGLSAVAALDGDDPAPTPEAPPAERFLAAWARSRAATFRSVSDFTRTSHSTGAELTDRLVVAQRPPDRLAVDGDGGTGLVEGRRLACTYRDRRLVCASAAAGRTYDDDVTRQLDTLGEYVTGDDPLYTVVAEGPDDRVGDCFVLTLARDLFAPPLGTRARYCFDAEIGAPTLTEIERVEADDVTRAISIEPEVTDADLDPDTALRDP